MVGIGMSSVDKELLAQTEKMLSAFTALGIEVEEIAKRIFDDAKREATEKYGDDAYLKSFGDKVLANKAFLSARHAAGLTTDDIQAYWNRPMILGLLEFKVREMLNFLVFDMARQQGKDLVALGHERIRHHPNYGDPESWNPSHPASQGLTAKDAPLFPEFIIRVGRWQEQTPEAEQQVLMGTFTSFNAMVRDLVGKGKI